MAVYHEIAAHQVSFGGGACHVASVKQHQNQLVNTLVHSILSEIHSFGFGHEQTAQSVPNCSTIDTLLGR